MANDLLKLAKKAGYSESAGFVSIGFVLQNLGASQISFLCTLKLNEYTKDNPWISPCVFYIENIGQCIDPQFPRYNLIDAAAYTGSLITTSLETIVAIKNFTTAKQYFYIYDVNFFDKPEANTIMKNKNIIKFTRCKDYYNLLISKGYEISPVIVEDFDINKILEIING